MTDRMLHKKSYLFSRGLGTLSSSIFTLTIIWWFQTETDSSSMVGAMNALFSLASSLAIVYGPFIDRHPLKNISIGSLAVQTFMFFLLTITINNTKYSLSFILVFSTIAAIRDEFFIPADRAIIKSTVKSKKELGLINSQISLVDQSINFLGVALAGVLLNFMKVLNVMVLITIISFIGIIILLFAIKDIANSKRKENRKTKYLEEILYGYKFIKKDNFLKNYFISSSLYSFVTPSLIVFLPYLAQKMGSSFYYTVFYICFFVGFIFGALFSGRIVPSINTVGIYWSLSFIPLFLLLFFYTNGILTAILIFLFGLTSSIQNISSETLIQVRTKDEFLGRVMTTFKTISSIGGPIGSLLAGFFLDNGWVWVLIIFSALLVITGGGLIVRSSKLIN